MITDAELYNAIGTKVQMLRDEADSLEKVANALVVRSSVPSTPSLRDTAKDSSVLHSDAKNPLLVERIKSLILANGGKMSRTDIISEMKRVTRGHTKHIAVVAALRSTERFKEVSEGVFSVA